MLAARAILASRGVPQTRLAMVGALIDVAHQRRMEALVKALAGVR